ncbi:hypothetical protein QBC40DRAFT_347197 [Triangularia verruculosa]|uniref:Uncharacterized protein n=1 Tax=Triangularia verruculosa TaxID=2587418 RepID=A0AAN6XQY1_9PEZI|nr:hypothetical protein QBC40DRAFT_347197 [Triangularia verruculosa]
MVKDDLERQDEQCPKEWFCFVSLQGDVKPDGTLSALWLRRRQDQEEVSRWRKEKVPWAKSHERIGPRPSFIWRRHAAGTGGALIPAADGGVKEGPIVAGFAVLPLALLQQAGGLVFMRLKPLFLRYFLTYFLDFYFLFTNSRLSYDTHFEEIPSQGGVCTPTAGSISPPSTPVIFVCLGCLQHHQQSGIVKTSFRCSAPSLM